MKKSKLKKSENHKKKGKARKGKRTKVRSREVIIKRKGHKEPFDERKVYASVYSACLTAGKNEKICEEIAEKISKEVKKWIRGRKEILSDEIFRKVIHELHKIDKNAAFMYETHLDVS